AEIPVRYGTRAGRRGGSAVPRVFPAWICGHRGLCVGVPGARGPALARFPRRPLPETDPAPFPGPWPPGRGHQDGSLDRIPGGFGVVAAPGRGGPPEGPVGKLIHCPPGLLLEPMVMPALRTPIAQARASARLVRGVVLKIALASGPPADRAGTGR